MTRARSKRARTHKRSLFAELTEGMSALAQARQGRRTLRTHAVDFKPAPEVTPRELVRVRQRLKVSRGLFAAARARSADSKSGTMATTLPVPT